MTSTATTAAISRHQLLDVLVFLERRGATADVLKLAMMRADIHPDVAQLLAQCIASGQLQPLDATLPAAVAATPAALPAPLPMARPREKRHASHLALLWLLRTGVVWGLFLAGGLALGFAFGVDAGIAHGIEQGLDRLQLALAGG